MLIKSLKESWSFFKIHSIALSIIILPIAAPVEIFSSIYEYFLNNDEFNFIEQIVPMAVNAITTPIYAIAVIFYMASVITGETLGTKTLWKLGAKFWLPYIIMTAMIIIAVISGFILLIVPGIILIVRFSFSEFDLLLNKSKPLDALKNSWSETKEYMWVIFGGLVLITLALYVPFYLITSIFEGASIFYWVLYTLLNIAYSVLAVLYTIFAFRIYEHTKSQHNKAIKKDV